MKIIGERKVRHKNNSEIKNLLQVLLYSNTSAIDQGVHFFCGKLLSWGTLTEAALQNTGFFKTRWLFVNTARIQKHDQWLLFFDAIHHPENG
jgi:hypothetical protein